MNRQVVLVDVNDVNDVTAYESTFSYFAGPEVKEGDLVVIDLNNVYGVGRVAQTRGLSDNQLRKAEKWIIQKIDRVAYNARMKKEKLVQEIKNKLDAKAKQAERRSIWKQLAEADPEMNALLSELNEVESDMWPGMEESKKLEDSDGKQ